MKSINYLLLSLVLACTSACNKEPGEGGTSSISGKIYRIETNVLGDTLAEYYAPDRDIYIIYGAEGSIYDDSYESSYDGSFQFTHLTPGKYKVFAYSRCDTCPSGDTIVSKTVDITEKKTDYPIGDLVVYK